MESFIDEGAEVLDVAAILLLNSLEVSVTVEARGGQQELHIAGNFTTTGVTKTARFAFNGAMTKPNILHNIFITPVLGLLAQLWFGGIDDWELKIAEEGDEGRSAMLRVDRHIWRERDKLANNGGAGTGLRRQGFRQTESHDWELGGVLLDEAGKVAILVA